jgi:putative two-component system response regulator
VNSQSNGTVLVVEDDEANARLLTRILQSQGYSVTTVGDGEAAVRATIRQQPDVLLLDVQLPTIDGFEVCRRVKADHATRFTPVIFLTGLAAEEHRLAGIDAGADDFLSKPFSQQELRARVRSLVRLKRRTDELESAESVIMSLALTVEARDPYTSGHCQRLAAYATALATELRLPEEAISAIKRGAILHDVGKVGIPDAILLKPSKLTASEFEIMQTHTEIGDALCGDMRSLVPVRPIIRHHHERLDGSGYPDGLSGDGVPLLAQLVGLVDAYDAMTTVRPYQTARAPVEACRELLESAERGKFNPGFVERFVGMIDSGRIIVPQQEFRLQ